MTNKKKLDMSSPMESMSQLPAKNFARNEPCPCGSQKKYKRCCGVSAPPQLTLSTQKQPEWASETVSAFNQMDPSQKKEMERSFKKLPRAQIEKFKSLMDQALKGKDISKEALELEKKLPSEFRALMQTWGQTMGSDAPSVSEPPFTEMTPQQARTLVMEAAKTGKISQVEADALLKKPSEVEVAHEPQKEIPTDSKPFWKIFSRQDP